MFGFGSTDNRTFFKSAEIISGDAGPYAAFRETCKQQLFCILYSAVPAFTEQWM